MTIPTKTPIPFRSPALVLAVLPLLVAACTDAPPLEQGAERGADVVDATDRPTILFVDAAGDVSRMLRLEPGADDAEVVRPELADGSRGLTLDRTEGILYWASRDADQIQFGRWNDASISRLQLTGLDSAYAVEFVPEENALYWSDYGTDALHRLDLGGGAPETLVTGLVAPRQIALDREGGWIFWVDRGAGTVQRASWEGGSAVGPVETLVTGMAAPYGIALDRTSGTLLVGDAEVGAIYRLDPDRPTLEDWLPEAGTHPSFLAVDELTRTLYWTDNRDNVLRRRPLAGGEIEVLVDGLAGPRGLVLIR